MEREQFSITIVCCMDGRRSRESEGFVVATSLETIIEVDCVASRCSLGRRQRRHVEGQESGKATSVIDRSARTREGSLRDLSLRSRLSFLLFLLLLCFEAMMNALLRKKKASTGSSTSWSSFESAQVPEIDGAVSAELSLSPTSTKADPASLQSFRSLSLQERNEGSPPPATSFLATASSLKVPSSPTTSLPHRNPSNASFPPSLPKLTRHFSPTPVL